MVINKATAARMKVIANRTGDTLLSAAKAMQIELLKSKMTNGVAHFAFMKKDGTIREAFGTIQSNIAAAKTNGFGISRGDKFPSLYSKIRCVQISCFPVVYKLI